MLHPFVDGNHLPFGHGVIPHGHGHGHDPSVSPLGGQTRRPSSPFSPLPRKPGTMPQSSAAAGGRDEILHGGYDGDIVERPWGFIDLHAT